VRLIVIIPESPQWTAFVKLTPEITAGGGANWITVKVSFIPAREIAILAVRCPPVRFSPALRVMVPMLVPVEGLKASHVDEQLRVQAVLEVILNEAVLFAP
jgi:hypothetical protein